MQQLQLEILHVLSGRPNILPTVQVRHFSPTALRGVVEHITRYAKQLDQLRSACASTTSMTAQAFAEATRATIQEVDAWLAEVESAFVLPSSSAAAAAASSPLQLSLAFTNRFAEILAHLASFLPYLDQPHALLNAIHAALSASPTRDSRLANVFTRTATPMWRLIETWLRGMPVPAALLDPEADSVALETEAEFDPEFFVQRDKDVAWTDEDFWECAWIVRGDDAPQWLDGDVLGEVIEAGKARGLLRAFEWEGDVGEWSGIEKIVRKEEGFKESLSEWLRPMCAAPQRQLRAEMEGCGLLEHLEAVEGTMFMRGWDVMDVWTGWLFTKVSAIAESASAGLTARCTAARSEAQICSF